MSLTWSQTPKTGFLVTRLILLTLLSYPATCPVLPDISGGTVVYLTDGTVTYATYTCDDQYDLYGSQSRPCQADYTWGGEEPSCSKYNRSVQTRYILRWTPSMFLWNSESQHVLSLRLISAIRPVSCKCFVLNVLMWFCRWHCMFLFVRETFWKTILQ